MSWDPNQGNPNSGPNPYGTPSNPYGTPPPQGNPNYPPNYGYSVAAAAPLPLNQAVQQLPSQYTKVLTKPSAQTFAEEMGKASWDIVWVQLLIYAVAAAIFGFIGTVTNAAMLPFGNSNVSSLGYFTAGRSFGLIIGVPLGFFIWNGIVYGLARAFGGQGTFLQQGYTYNLFAIPLGIIAAIASIIPIVGWLLSLAAFVYEIVLNIFSIQAVHRLSGGKASAVVLIPFGVILLLVCGLCFLLIFVIAAAVRTTTP